MEPRGNIARKEILREVFEDNLRTVRGEPSVRRPKRTLRPSRQGTILAVLAGFLLLASGAIYMGGLIRSVDAGAEPWVGRRTAGLPPVTERATAPPVLEPAGDEAVPGLPSRPTVAQLYGLTPRTIVIDPGHGGIDPGTSGQGGLTEKMVTLDVAHRLRARLARYPGYRVLLTREADERMSLRERIDFANEHRADLFISLHVNWVPDTSLVPIETYYYGPGSDARATRLAQRENRNAGYTLAEFNELTRQLGLELKIQESKALAGSIQNVLYRNMRRIDERVSNWGAKTGDFMVLLGVRAPSVLVEITSLNSPGEEARLNTSAHREELAMFLEQGIVAYLQPHANENEPTDHAAEEKDEGSRRNPVRGR